MLSSEKKEIKEMMEIVINRRIRLHRLDIEERKVGIENGSAAGLSGGVIARGFLLDSWADSLRQHSNKTLSDLLALLAIFDDARSVECIRRAFRDHVDQAASDLLGRLRKNDHEFSNRPAERNKFSNMVAAIKVDADRLLNLEAEKAEQRQRRTLTSSRSPASELDDRLPLGRRGFFDRDLVAMVKEAKLTGEPLGMVMVDIDRFKAVNDTYGHQTGDEVLIAVAELVKKRLGAKGRAYRYGGEEFALLLPDYSSEEAVGLAERIRKDIEAAAVSDRKLKVTASFGLASFPSEAGDAPGLVRKSDAALYQAKQAGRNCVKCLL